MNITQRESWFFFSTIFESDEVLQQDALYVVDPLCIETNMFKPNLLRRVHGS